jgi:hypothetical protein
MAAQDTFTNEQSRIEPGIAAADAPAWVLALGSLVVSVSCWWMWSVWHLPTVRSLAQTAAPALPADDVQVRSSDDATTIEVARYRPARTALPRQAQEGNPQ